MSDRKGMFGMTDKEFIDILNDLSELRKYRSKGWFPCLRSKKEIKKDKDEYPCGYPDGSEFSYDNLYGDQMTDAKKDIIMKTTGMTIDELMFYLANINIKSKL